MSQPHPTQHPAVSDMQLWQQKLMYQQLQELQRQQQCQQLDQGARHQNSRNQPAIINEAPIHNVLSYMWANNFFGSLPTLPDNSHMYSGGNINRPQPASPMHNISNGIIISNDQSPSMRSMGYIPDQSLHGIPVSNSRGGSVNHYSRLSDMSNDCNNLMTKEAGWHAEKVSDQFNYFQNTEHLVSQGCPETLGTAQNFQGKGFVGHTSMEILNSDETPINLQQTDSQNQTFYRRQEHPDWSGNMHEKPVEQLGTSNHVSSLDPTEQKILFGTDNDNWGSSFSGSVNSSAGGLLQGIPILNDYLGGFPSIQSGIWSAMMQEAVQASTSNEESPEEWSGLDFQNIDQSVFKHQVMSSGSDKHVVAWNDTNLQSVSLTTKSLPLFNDSEAGQSSCHASTFQPPLETTPVGHNRIQVGASHSHPLFQLSSRHTSDKQLHQVQKQNQLSEAKQVHAPENNEMRVEQPHKQQENSSSDAQSGWTHQDLHMSNNARQSSNTPNDWNTNYQGGFGNSKFSGDDDMQGFSASYAAMNNGVQLNETNIGISQVHSKGCLSNYRSKPSLNNGKIQQSISSQKVCFGKTFTLDPCVNSESNQNVKKIHNQNMELPTKTCNEGLINNYDSNIDHKLVSGGGYVSNKPYGRQSNIVSGENEISSLTGHDLHSSQHEYLRPSAHPGKQTVGSNMFQNQSSNLEMNVEASHPAKSWSCFQGPHNSIIEGSKSEEKIFTGKPTFNDQIVPNGSMDVTKRIATEAEDSQSRDDILVHDSTPFDQSAVTYSQNKNIVQTSQNMFELLHKVDHSGNCSNIGESDRTPEQIINTPSSLCNQSSEMQGFGLQLALPSQRRQHSRFAFSSQMSTNDGKSRLLSHEAGDNEQMLSTYAPSRQALSPDESLEKEHLSDVSGEKHEEASESGEKLRSSFGTVPGLPYLGNQQHQVFPRGETFFLHQLHQRHVSRSTEHEVSHQSVKFHVENQNAEHAIIKNSSSQWKPQDPCDGVTGQSVPPSFPTPVRGATPSRLVPLTDTHVFASSKSSSAVTDNMKKMVVGFPQVQNSSPLSETNSGSQPSVFGMAQQADFSRMLRYVWPSTSGQQHLAGLHPAKLTPQLLHSIINNTRETNSWGLQKGDYKRNVDENTPDVGTGYSNMGHVDEHQVQGNFLKPLNAKVNSSSKTATSSPGEELAKREPPVGDFAVSVSSLVRLHQQDMERGKGGRGSTNHFHAVNTCTSTVSSSNSDVVFSGETSMSLDARQQNYSLLHQMQAMKDSDSDPSRMLRMNPKGSDYTSTSNVPQMLWNTSQKSVNVQNPSLRKPTYDKVSGSSQDALPSDFKMYKIGAKNEGNRSSTSAPTAWEHDLQSSMQPHCPASATNLIFGTEGNQISSQMAPSWFEKYGNYKNGAMITSANFNSQSSMNASAHYLSQKIPGRMSYDPAVDKGSDNKFITHGQSSVAAYVTSEIPSHILNPPIIDHGIAQKSKKRKRLASKLPWHKLFTEGPQRLPSLRTGELDWAQAANRLIEKGVDETDTMESSSMIQPQRRLILTTQLMQQLLPAVPARILKEEATSSYERMTFCVAKSVLADACGILFLEARDFSANLENQSWAIKKLKTSKGDNVVKIFVERSKKLDSDFLRLEKKTSLLDVRLECQELERFSIVNRLGKFHGRPQTDVVEGSSNPEAASRRTFLQRYVTAVSLSGSLPEGIMCLSI